MASSFKVTKRKFKTPPRGNALRGLLLVLLVGLVVYIGVRTASQRSSNDIDLADVNLDSAFEIDGSEMGAANDGGSTATDTTTHSRDTAHEITDAELAAAEAELAAAEKEIDAAVKQADVQMHEEQVRTRGRPPQLPLVQQQPAPNLHHWHPFAWQQPSLPHPFTHTTVL